MFNRINLLLLLLLCLVYHSGNTPKSVSGEKGGNATLTCEFADKKYFKMELSSKSDIIPVCEDKNCSYRVFKEEACDFVIKDLKLSDAGKYILRAYYYDQAEVKWDERTYQLQIHDEISVKTGGQLKLHVMFSTTDKVERNFSGEWREVWSTTHRVQSDGINVTDANLIINEFMPHDAGSYRVLDAEGKTLITVTVTETGMETNQTQTKIKPDEHKDHTEAPPAVNQNTWLISFGVLVLVLVLVLIVLIVKKPRCRHYTQAPIQDNPEPPMVLENL